MAGLGSVVELLLLRLDRDSALFVALYQVATDTNGLLRAWKALQEACLSSKVRSFAT